jgi:outer membrane protein assembly factor BamA
MSIRVLLFALTIIIVLSGCSNTRKLAGDQMLYTGRTKVDIKTDQKLKKTSSVKFMVESVTNHKINNSLFGKRILPPIGLWVHNYCKPKKIKKSGNWFYNTFSSNPILISDVNPELRAQKLENELFDQGYFQAKVWAEVDTNKKNTKKAKVSYYVDLTSPYFLNQVIFEDPADPIDTLLGKYKFKGIIKEGEQFNFSELKTARIDLSRKIQENGYYYFISDYLISKADTTIGKNKMDLFIGKKKDLPLGVYSQYQINNIIIKISKSSTGKPVIADTSFYNDVTIISDGLILKPEVLVNSLNFKSGDTYSYSKYQQSINNLNNLGLFKYVNITYKPVNSDSLSGLLDIRIDILVADNINFDIEVNLVAKSNAYFGPAVSTGVAHINAFHGAEKLQVRLNGGFEWQWGTKSENQLGTYSYEYGLNVALVYPRIILPEFFKRQTPLISKHTGINTGLNILNRAAYYRMYSAQAGLNYQWGARKEIQHTFYPVYINSVNLLETTPEFDSTVNENIYIKKSFEEQFILGFRYDFSFNNSFNLKPSNFYFLAGISTSGNLIDLFTSRNKSDSERPYYFMNNIYSQFIKLTSDFRYYRNAFNSSIVFRLYAGVGIPYGNSAALPYVEQFFSGGAYSIRGFTSRYLGPGSYYEESDDYIDQSGDLKLESNIEYRFKMSKVLNGAIFLETGNIWLINEDVNRPGSQFNINTFYNELAVGSGLGLRFDFTFFVLRLDYGVPLRNPYKTEDRNWLFGTDNIFSEGKFHLAIGYPF